METSGLGDREHEEPQPWMETQVEIDQRQAMNEVMTNYFIDEELPHDGEHRRPPKNHTRQQLWEEAKEHAEARIYAGARLSKLSTILEILNLKTKYNASDMLINDIFRLMHELILPQENSLPGSWKEAKKVLRAIGMKHEVIHACPNDCILFRKEHKHEVTCPECGASRYKENMLTKKVPQKAMRYFPLVPRLLHTFRCSDLADYQVWHSNHRSDSGTMRMTVDSHVNKFVEGEWPEFRNDPRNIWLGLATDGISPFNVMGKAQRYAVWPVVLVNYNIPPWMSMKKGHLILSMLIPGPRQPTSLDVYMAPLIEELEELWKGVPAYDNRRTTGGLPRSFDLRAILLWTMHDYAGKQSLVKL